MRIRTGIAMAAALVLAVGACGNDDDDGGAGNGSANGAGGGGGGGGLLQPAADAPDGHPVCSLLSAEEISAAVGDDYERSSAAGTAGPTNCSWSSPEGAELALFASTEEDRASFDERRANVEEADHLEISGNDAFFLADSTLYVWADPGYFELQGHQLGGPDAAPDQQRDALTEIAGHVLDRW